MYLFKGKVKDLLADIEQNMKLNVNHVPSDYPTQEDLITNALIESVYEQEVDWGEERTNEEPYENNL